MTTRSWPGAGAAKGQGNNKVENYRKKERENSTGFHDSLRVHEKADAIRLPPHIASTSDQYSKKQQARQRTDEHNNILQCNTNNKNKSTPRLITRHEELDAKYTALANVPQGKEGVTPIGKRNTRLKVLCVTAIPRRLSSRPDAAEHAPPSFSLVSCAVVSRHCCPIKAKINHAEAR